MRRFTELEEIVGIGPAAAKKLRENGVPCAEVLAFIPVDRLNHNTRIGEGTACKIITAAREHLGLGRTMNGLDREQQWQHARRLTTGVGALDDSLLGGIDAGSLVDLYGPARGGKSQMCHQLVTTAQLPEERGGLDSGTVWLDSEGSFRPLTLRANAVRFGLDPETVLSQVSVQTIISRQHLLESVWRLPDQVYKNSVFLIVIDSLGKFFRTDSEYLLEQRANTMDLAEILLVLQGLITTMGCIVVVTNQVYNKVENYGGNPNAPVGGHIMAHAATYRFYLRRMKEDQRRIRLEDHVGLPESEADLRLGWGGFFGTEQERKVVSHAIVDYLGTLGHSVGITEGRVW